MHRQLRDANIYLHPWPPHTEHPLLATSDNVAMSVHFHQCKSGRCASPAGKATIRMTEGTELIQMRVFRVCEIPGAATFLIRWGFAYHVES